MPYSPFWEWISLSDDGGAGGDAFFKSLRASGNLSDSDILAREVIQNSWDSALKQRETIKDQGLEFRMVFEFKEFKGEEKKKFIKSAALGDFLFPLSNLPTDDAYRIRFQSELNALKSNAPLQLLYCSDYGGHGLFGHPSLLKGSILYRALYYLGGPTKVQGVAGGNYGFGKGAFVKGSKLHIVFAYSTFDKTQNDKVQRRLVGCSFWDQFGTKFDGRGRFGVRAQTGPSVSQKIVPYEDTEAEEMANLLGFTSRGISGAEDFGASFMLVAPTVSPEELKDSIEQNWWPAIEEKSLRFNVQIKGYDGTKIAMRPRENKVAKHFISPYISALELTSERMDQRTLGAYVTNVQRQKHGVLYAHVLKEQAEDSLVDGRGDHLIHGRIALIRGPRMVVSYKHYPIKTAICGVFVADDKYDKELQATEPPLHYQWAIEPSSDIMREHTEAAKVVMRGIRSRLNKWLEVLTPPPPREDTYVQLFADLLAPFMSGKNPPPPPPPPRYEPISIRFASGPNPAAVKGGKIRTEASFSVKTSDQFKDENIDVVIGTEFQITEDDKDSGDSWGFELSLIGKKERAFRDGKGWRLRLTPDDELKFTFISDPYNSNYSGKLKTFVLEGNK